MQSSEQSYLIDNLKPTYVLEVNDILCLIQNSVPTQQHLPIDFIEIYDQEPKRILIKTTCFSKVLQKGLNIINLSEPLTSQVQSQQKKQKKQKLGSNSLIPLLQSRQEQDFDDYYRQLLMKINMVAPCKQRKNLRKKQMKEAASSYFDYNFQVGQIMKQNIQFKDIDLPVIRVEKDKRKKIFQNLQPIRLFANNKEKKVQETSSAVVQRQIQQNVLSKLILSKGVTLNSVQGVSCDPNKLRKQKPKIIQEKQKQIKLRSRSLKNETSMASTQKTNQNASRMAKQALTNLDVFNITINQQKRSNIPLQREVEGVSKQIFLRKKVHSQSLKKLNVKLK